MAIAAGTRLGPHEIEAPLGAGGYGLPTPGQEKTFFLGIIGVSRLDGPP